MKRLVVLENTGWNVQKREKSCAFWFKERKRTQPKLTWNHFYGEKQTTQSLKNINFQLMKAMISGFYLNKTIRTFVGANHYLLRNKRRVLHNIGLKMLTRPQSTQTKFRIVCNRNLMKNVRFVARLDHLSKNVSLKYTDTDKKRHCSIQLTHRFWYELWSSSSD